MTKRQLIDEIVTINRTAETQFLARFDEDELGEYLSHLNRARMPRLTGDARRYDKYFRFSHDRAQADRSQLAAAGVSRFRTESAQLEQPEPKASDTQGLF